MSTEKSYAQIVKASSIMGGAAAISMLLGVIRVKFAATLIGTSGVGLNASFTAIQTLIGTLAGLGLQSSAVRDIAAAVSKDDQQEIGRKVITLRRISWFTGFIGMVTMMLLSPIISQITFGHQKYALDIAGLSVVILFVNLSSGQIALIQGMRRIGDIARVNVFAGILATIAAIGFYATLGLRGIVPALVTASCAQLTLSWYFARKVLIPKVSLSIKQTFLEANNMVQLGLVMMFSSLMVSIVTYATVILITKQEGINALGLFSAAFTLSGIFVNFVLSAMAADYYPRLTSVAMNKDEMGRLVNEQTEIAILLALPGLLFTMAFAPWLVEIFYSREFIAAVELLQWFILGCLGRVISWPLGFVMLALSKGRWFLLTETTFNLVHIALISLGLQLFGIEGVAIAFVVMYFGYIATVLLVCQHLIGFKWSAECTRIGLLSLPVLGVIFSASRLLPIWPATFIGLSLTLVVSVLCLRGLVARVGYDHRIIRTIKRLPGGKRLLISR